MDGIALHQPWLAKLKALVALGKVKLSAMVVFSGFVGALHFTAYWLSCSKPCRLYSLFYGHYHGC